MKENGKVRSTYRVPPNWRMQFRRQLELEEKSQRTVQKYLHDISVMMEYLAPKRSICKEDVIAYKAWLLEEYAVRSANSMLAATNRFLNFLGAEDCYVKLFRIQNETFCDKRSELNREEYERLLEAAHRNGRIQLYYILQTLCATGIRVGELQYITVEALTSGRAIARNKGKSRVILIPSVLCTMLRNYAAENGITTGPVFISKYGNPVDRSSIWRGMHRLCQAAEVGEEKVYPHNLRHLFARTFYQKEKDITHLADILGHQNVNTTRIYVVSSGEEHRAQIEALGLAIPQDISRYATLKAQHNDILCCAWDDIILKKSSIFAVKFIHNI